MYTDDIKRFESAKKYAAFCGLAIENSKACVQIEMFGIIESLNLGTATGIVLYEITKQRREYQNKFKKGRRKDPEVVTD